MSRVPRDIGGMARGKKRAHAAEEVESVEEEEEEEEEVEEESGAEEEESDDKDSDDDGSSNDEDVALDMAEAPGTAQELQVEFGFFDPRPEDYHHFKALLQAGSFWRGPEWDTPGLATLLSEQASVGTVIKADEDVFGFMSVLSLQFHREQPCVQQFTSHIMQRTGSAKATARLKALLAPSAKPVGLILSERMLNTPHALVPSAVDSLMQAALALARRMRHTPHALIGSRPYLGRTSQDVAWAVDNEVDEAHRASVKFDRLLLLAQAALHTTCYMLHATYHIRHTTYGILPTANCPPPTTSSRSRHHPAPTPIHLRLARRHRDRAARASARRCAHVGVGVARSRGPKHSSPHDRAKESPCEPSTFEFARAEEDVLAQAHACCCAVYVASACCCAVYVARRGAREGGCALAGTRLLL